MSLSDDTVAILSSWDQTMTVVRRAVTYADTGSRSVTWSSQGTILADIQPVSADIARLEIGDKVKTTHEIFATDGADVLAGDRLRTSSFSSGDDEYQVTGVNIQDPSHVRILAVLVKGHGD